MIKIMQDKFGFGGNCMSACIAMILNKPLNEVPWFAEGMGLDSLLTDQEKADLFYDRIQQYLQSMGLEVIVAQWHSSDVQAHIKKHPGYYIVSGKSPRGLMHAVIYRGFKLYHDPHPDGGGVIPEYVDFIQQIQGN